jgi:C4-dicarboxylate-binding protein DctP
MEHSIKKLFARAAVVALAFAPAAAVADTFTLRIGSGHALGPVTYVNTSHEFLVPEIERRVAERTDHKVKFVEAYGGSIAKTGETLEAVEKGILDMGHVCFCFEPAKAPLQNLNYFVPFSTPSAVQQLAITRKVYEQFPVMTEMFPEQYGQTLLALTGYDNYNLGTSFAWDKFADLEGHKIGGAGANLTWFENSGMTVVQAGIPEFYTGIQTGVIEGASLFPSSYYGLKLHEIAPHYKIVNFGAMIVNGLFINNKTLEKLPVDVADIIREVAAEYEVMTAQTLDAAQADGLEKLRAAGAQITDLSAEERQAWAERLQTLPARKAKEFTDLGYDGPAIFNAYFKAAEEAGFTFPVPYSVE